MAKVIQCTLGTIEDAIQELEAYKRHIEDSNQRLVKRVGDELSALISQKMNGAIADYYFNAEGHNVDNVDYSIDVNANGDLCVVAVNGRDAVFVEFGTGVYHNGSASPHPMAVTVGAIIGGYGKGHGKRNTWYFNRDGETFRTHGIPARMPVWKAAKEIAPKIEQIAREVFR